MYSARELFIIASGLTSHLLCLCSRFLEGAYIGGVADWLAKPSQYGAMLSSNMAAGNGCYVRVYNIYEVKLFVRLQMYTLAYTSSYSD